MHKEDPGKTGEKDLKMLALKFRVRSAQAKEFLQLPEARRGKGKYLTGTWPPWLLGFSVSDTDQGFMHGQTICEQICIVISCQIYGNLLYQSQETNIMGLCFPASDVPGDVSGGHVCL